VRLRSDEGFRVWSLAEPKSGEGEIIQRFFDGIEKFTPQIVSWNGGGFDLPVLHYRGLIHGVSAPRYWDMGEGDYRDSRDFKWNNYISRYHMRHTDLMDLLAMYQPRGSAPLDQLARLMGLPGKLGMDGSAVWGAWLEGRIAEIRDYCETDVVNTFLVFLRFQMMRGLLSKVEHEANRAGQIVAGGDGAAALERVHHRLGGIMLIDASNNPHCWWWMSRAGWCRRLPAGKLCSTRWSG
jgi:predicted PolB exonuclease-like 3'-5' exonuclease